MQDGKFEKKRNIISSWYT